MSVHGTVVCSLDVGGIGKTFEDLKPFDGQQIGRLSHLFLHGSLLFGVWYLGGHRDDVVVPGRSTHVLAHFGEGRNVLIFGIQSGEDFNGFQIIIFGVWTENGVFDFQKVLGIQVGVKNSARLFGVATFDLIIEGFDGFNLNARTIR